MPLYEYACASGHIKKEVRSIHAEEPAEILCDECAKPMIQVLGGVGVSFKGSGFYSTDKGSGG
jgi:putative FmdB family regulatory protein